jgi:hypothetical protein
MTPTASRNKRQMQIANGRPEPERNSKRERQDQKTHVVCIYALTRSELELVRRTGKFKKPILIQC